MGTGGDVIHPNMYLLLSMLSCVNMFLVGIKCVCSEDRNVKPKSNLIYFLCSLATTRAFLLAVTDAVSTIVSEMHSELVLEMCPADFCVAFSAGNGDGMSTF